MRDTWLRAEPLWFGVHLAPEHGFLPESKKAAKKAAQRTAERAAMSSDGSGGEPSGPHGARQRRRSISAERRRRALERGRRKTGDDGQ
ncbi:MAG: hypothetical protein MPN21_25945 [Thermoanaerobaculia bacterium]|nr:hypothetical protein [Thermoanaerobaculia bacterium]